MIEKIVLVGGLILIIIGIVLFSAVYVPYAIDKSFNRQDKTTSKGKKNK